MSKSNLTLFRLHFMLEHFVEYEILFEIYIKIMCIVVLYSLLDKAKFLYERVSFSYNLMGITTHFIDVLKTEHGGFIIIFFY